MELSKALINKFNYEEDYLKKIINYVGEISKKELSKEEYEELIKLFNSKIKHSGSGLNYSLTLNSLVFNSEDIKKHEDMIIFEFINILSELNLDVHKRITERLFEEMGYVFAIIPNSLNMYKAHVFRKYSDVQAYIKRTGLVMYKLHHIPPITNSNIITLNFMLDNLYKCYFNNKDDRKKDVLRENINKLAAEVIV